MVDDEPIDDADDGAEDQPPAPPAQEFLAAEDAMARLEGVADANAPVADAPMPQAADIAPQSEEEAAADVEAPAEIAVEPADNPAPPGDQDAAAQDFVAAQQGMQKLEQVADADQPADTELPHFPEWEMPVDQDAIKEQMDRLGKVADADQAIAQAAAEQLPDAPEIEAPQTEETPDAPTAEAQELFADNENLMRGLGTVAATDNEKMPEWKRDRINAADNEEGAELDQAGIDKPEDLEEMRAKAEKLAAAAEAGLPPAAPKADAPAGAPEGDGGKGDFPGEEDGDEAVREAEAAMRVGVQKKHKAELNHLQLLTSLYLEQARKIEQLTAMIERDRL